MNATTAKTQAASISRVLRGLGLKSGVNFQVEGLYDDGRRTGTGVYVTGDQAHEIISSNKARIETDAPGFHVGVSYTQSGKARTYVDNIKY